ncbi:MAG: hypothetical protein ACAH59_00475 [Pseudobdellovibrionaceae bacterium]
MKRAIPFLIFFLFSTSAICIRVVGNGGGEAELKVLQQFEALSLWLKFCSENSGECFLDPSTGKEEISKLKKNFSNLESIEFVNRSTFPQFGPQRSLMISHESLYVDDKTPKEDMEVFQVLLWTLREAPKTNSNSQKVNVRLLSNGILHSQLDVAYLRSEEGDFLVARSANQNLHRELSRELNSPYRILSTTAKGYLLKSFGDGQVYELILQDQNGHFELKLFFRDSDL